MNPTLNRREALALAAAGWMLTEGGLLGTEAGAAPFDTDPTRPSCLAYPAVPGIRCEDFQLDPEGMSPERRAETLQRLRSYQDLQKSHSLGFQANQGIHYREDLKPFLDFHINNVGDPFLTGSFTVNSKWMERAVLDYYARLWNARWPHDPDDPESYWGYVLSMGCTEGNIYGLWNGRDYLAGRSLLEDDEAREEARAGSRDGRPRGVPQRIVCRRAVATPGGPNAYRPVAFYSEDSHYSIIKAMRVLDIPTFHEVGTREHPGRCPITDDGTWPKEVPSVDRGGGPGSIDIDSLAALVEFFASRGHPILINFNYGTTFKGAYDDVEAAGRRLMPILDRHGLARREVDCGDGRRIERRGYWIHVDAALGGAYMPFVEKAFEAGRIPARGPNFDFRLPFVSSIAMSGHKWIGAPWPCGIFMTRTGDLLLPPSRPNYIGSRDSTLAGSRNGFSAIVLWDFLSRHSYDKQIERALQTQRLAEYAYRRLQGLERQVGDLWVERSPLSLTVRFRKASDRICLKYSLASESLFVDGEDREYSHLYAMPHVTRAMIDGLVEDLSEADAFALRAASTS